jgi:hypothetical protein
MRNGADRKSITVRGIKSPILLFGAVLLAAGCMSARVTTDLKPGADPALKSPAGRFYVAGLKYKYADSNPQIQPDQKTVAEAEQRLLPLLKEECASRYPALFAGEAVSGAIPLGVEVSCVATQHNGKTLGWMLGTLDLCGLIFPCPGQTDLAYEVQTGVWNGRNGLHGTPLQKNFMTENHFWVSVLTPSALIHMPGESDFPKASGSLMNIQSQMETAYRQAAQQVATALAQLVADKEPGFWTLPVGAESVPATTTAVPATTLPPPGETATPF